MVKQLDIRELLAQGAVRAREEDCEVLVSQVIPVKPMDPLAFFAYGAEPYAGERSFWADPNRDRILAGLGTAYRVEAEAEDRFAGVEARWRDLLRKSIREPHTHRNGTGPLLMGGFSFDPLKPKSGRWEEYADASMVLPRFLLTVAGEDCWLTVNAVIRPAEDPVSLADRLEREKQDLLSGVPATFTPMESPSFETVEVDPEAWKRSVAETAREIREGVMEKVVLARQLRVEASGRLAPASILKRLQEQQTDCFLFAVERGASCFLGASPERLVRRNGKRFLSTCLAGSIRRGSSPEEDERLGQELLSDGKNRVEHEVVVHMIREAFRTGCDAVEVPEEPVLYKAGYIQHLYTPVTGRARPGTTLLSMVKRLHPTPALGGYPQEKSVEKIREKERMDRGWYAGPVGWVDWRGDGEFAVAIRSALVKGDQAFLFAGCGIVGDSDPDSEYEEARIKFRPILSAMGGRDR
ncbi:isochorismate synthase [Paludifilum halophilum]|nr:isochorismate synthase [Paludifilum halophilum]